MTLLLNFWRNDDTLATKQTARVSKYLLEKNITFKLFLTQGSWVIYITAGLLIACCIYYYLYDCKRQMELRRRRQEAHRANGRLPQRRRPGAIYRDHEIFRNAMRTVRQYIGPSDSKNNKNTFVLRRTRSGAVYGRFADAEHY